VNQINYKTLAMQAHALTRTRYFYNLNLIISHPTVYKKGLGCLSVCVIASWSSPLSHVCICNSHPSSELSCVYCTVHNLLSFITFSSYYCFLVSFSSILFLFFCLIRPITPLSTSAVPSLYFIFLLVILLSVSLLHHFLFLSSSSPLSSIFHASVYAPP
jgi:hypothetical protein